MERRKIPDYLNYTCSECGKIFGKRGELTPYKRNDGYLSVKLYTKNEGKKFIRKGFLVHRLVATVYISNPDNLKLVNHKDGNKTNNHVNNLEWSTYKLNTKHAWENNMIGKWERSVVQLTADDKNIVKKFSSIKLTASETGFSYTSIARSCRNGRQYKGYFWTYDDNKNDKIPEDIADETMWKVVLDFPNYKVSKDGRIFSLKSKKLMKCQESNYLRVKVFLNGKPKIRYVHTFVAKAFLPNPHNLPIVNHKNGIRYDCKVENLEWCTAKQNSQHAVDIGLCSKPEGKRVIQYLKDGTKIASFPSIKAASIATSTNREGISHVCNGRRKYSGGWCWAFEK